MQMQKCHRLTLSAPSKIRDTKIDNGTHPTSPYFLFAAFVTLLIDLPPAGISLKRKQTWHPPDAIALSAVQ
jgi:hypothetical protein